MTEKTSNLEVEFPRQRIKKTLKNEKMKMGTEIVEYWSKMASNLVQHSMQNNKKARELTLTKKKELGAKRPI